MFRMVIHALSFIPIIALQWRATSDAPDADRAMYRTWVGHPFRVYLISSALWYVFYIAVLYSDTTLVDLWHQEGMRISSIVLDADNQPSPDVQASLPSMGYWLFRFIFGLLGGFVLSALIVQIKKSS